MRVLIGCERSGVVRRAFRARGHDAWSCDLEPADDASPYHYEGDVLWYASNLDWDLLIVHPPCTYLSVSGLHWNTRRPERAALTEAALGFVRTLLELPRLYYKPLRLALENPIGCISSRIRKPDQIIQPYEFGDDASKATCLWLEGLEPLRIDPSQRVPGRMVNGKERWSNQTDSGQNRLGPSPDRAKIRSETYPGIAAAMAAQWGGTNIGDLL